MAWTTDISSGQITNSPSEKNKKTLSLRSVILGTLRTAFNSLHRNANQCLPLEFEHINEWAKSNQCERYRNHTLFIKLL